MIAIPNGMATENFCLTLSGAQAHDRRVDAGRLNSGFLKNALVSAYMRCASGNAETEQHDQSILCVFASSDYMTLRGIYS